jgi:phospholipase C
MLCLTACGVDPRLVTSVSISGPGNAQAGVCTHFTASVNGTGHYDRSVTWFVADVAGGTAATGTIDASGNYCAPAQPPTPNPVSIKAVAQGDNSKFGSITTRVIAISITPTQAQLYVGDTQQFSAANAGATNGSLIWMVNGTVGGNSTEGTISPTGLYTAPSQVTNLPLSVQAAPSEAPSAYAIANLTVSGRVVITPSNPQVPQGDSQQFNATVVGSNDTQVNWRAAYGTITSSGLYTATGTRSPDTISAGSSNANGTTTVQVVGQTLQFSHVIFVIQENRTPDNLFGSNPTFEPGVDLATSGLNSLNQVIPLAPWPLAGGYDLGHGRGNFLADYNGGKMNGWPPGAFRYVDNSTGTVQPYFDIARQYGWANRMFQTNQGQSLPAHLFLLAGTAAPSTFSDLFIAGNAQDGIPLGCPGPPTEHAPTIDPDGVEGSVFPCFDDPTLVDNLDAASLSWTYYGADATWIAPIYIKNLCLAGTNKFGQPACTGPANLNGKPTQQFLVDVQNCNLSNVTWVTPTGDNSDHASGNAGGGPSWVAAVVNAIGNSHCGYWQDTAILITWDDWGGWYDHVPPPQIGQSNGWGKSYVYGFRVPLLVVSAYTPAGLVDNKMHDFGSMLRFAETNFKLGLIGPGTWADSYADNLADFFTLTSPRDFTTVPALLPAEYFINSTDKSPPDDD